MKSPFDHTIRTLLASAMFATLISGCFLIPEKPEPEGLQAIYPVHGIKVRPYPVTFTWANATSADRRILLYREDVVNPVWDQSVSGTGYLYPFPLAEGYAYRWGVQDGDVTVGGRFEVGYIMEDYVKEYQVEVINTPFGGMPPETLSVPIAITFDKNSNQVSVDIDHGRSLSLPLVQQSLMVNVVSYQYLGSVPNHGCQFNLFYEEDSLDMWLHDNMDYYTIQAKLK
jgi:hypothetical protein